MMMMMMMTIPLWSGFLLGSRASAVAVVVGTHANIQLPEEPISRSRHSTWTSESERILNDHIALEMAAAIQYRAMFAYAYRDYVNLKNSAKFFEDNAKEEFQHAYELMEYQIKRGGKVELKALDAPVHEFAATTDQADVRVLFESALALEKRVYDSFLAVHALCGKNNDPQCQDKIDEYLQDQIEAIDEIARYVADLNRVGTSGQSAWLWDNEFDSSD